MENELRHHGILGQKWGVRRYQNEDGSLTPAGQKRYSNTNSGYKKYGKDIAKTLNKMDDESTDSTRKYVKYDMKASNSKDADKRKQYEKLRNDALDNISKIDAECQALIADAVEKGYTVSRITTEKKSAGQRAIDAALYAVGGIPAHAIYNSYRSKKYDKYNTSDSGMEYIYNDTTGLTINPRKRTYLQTYQTPGVALGNKYKVKYN